MRVETYAGLRGQPGDCDGRRDAATFYFPDRVLEDSRGELYVGERATSRLRHIRADGVTQTLALVGRANGRELALSPYGRMVVTQDDAVYVNAEGWLWRASLKGADERLEFARGPQLALRSLMVEGDRFFRRDGGSSR